ncbi:ATP-binding protein, partial [Pseudomonas syringae pv. tagetis]
PNCARSVDESPTVNPEADLHMTPYYPVIVSFDGDRLEQVVSNLIGKAVQHRNSRDPVEVTQQVSEAAQQIVEHNTGSTNPEHLLPYNKNPI